MVRKSKCAYEEDHILKIRYSKEFFCNFNLKRVRFVHCAHAYHVLISRIGTVPCAVHVGLVTFILFNLSKDIEILARYTSSYSGKH